MQNIQKAMHTLDIAKKIQYRTNLSIGEIIIKLTALEMTPEEIIEENRELEMANFGGYYGTEEIML